MTDTEFPTARVIWKARAIGQDINDPGGIPEEIPLDGIKVDLIPSPKVIECTNGAGDPVTYRIKEWHLVTANNGELINYEDPTNGIEIVASDAFPGYVVSWKSIIEDPSGTLPPIIKKWLAPAGSIVDLTTVISVPNDPNPLADYLRAVYDTREARDKAIQAAADAERAEQTALAAMEVEQVTLTGNLALTIPEGHPSGQVYRCAITQTTGGHTVTYDGQPVTVDLTAGAETLVEIWPNGEVAYPVATPLLSMFARHGAAPARTVTTPGAQSGYRRLHIDEAGRIFRGRVGNGIEISTDNGATWTTLGTFPTPPGAAYLVADGELLVVTTDNYPTNTIKSAVYRSSGLAAGCVVTFSKVLEADDYQQAFGFGWQCWGADGTYVMNEYDHKAPGSRSAAQHAWITTDNGETWRVIYDHGNGSPSSRHIHGAAWDPWRQAIWLTLGDYTGSSNGDRRIIVSWDMGDNWTTVTTDHQPTVVRPFPNCVIFGSDNAPNGILRIDNPSPTSLVLRMNYPLGSGTILTHVAEDAFQRVGEGYPLLVPFSATIAGQQSVVLGTYDGIAWWEVWRDSRTYTGASKGANRVCGPDNTGAIHIVGTDDTGMFATIVQDDYRATISALSRAASHAIKAVPRKAIMSLANQSSPAYQSLVAYTPATVLMNPTPSYKLDPSGLLTPSATGITVNRDAFVNIYGIVPLSGGTMAKHQELAVLLNGAWVLEGNANSIAVELFVAAGTLISLRANLAVNNTLSGSGRCLVVSAEEVA